MGHLTAEPIDRNTAMAPKKSARLRQDIYSFLVEFAKGKHVLDIGCMAHTPGARPGPLWLHGHICAAAASVVGLDIQDLDEVTRLNAQGYNIRVGDACTIDLGMQFERIIAGEIIEHVDTPGMLLKNMAGHLCPGGEIAVTTPNVFYARHFFESVFMDVRNRWNEEHVQWYDPFTLSNAFERAGLEVDRIYYFTRSRKLLRMMRTFPLPCWSWLASNICVIGRKPS